MNEQEKCEHFFNNEETHCVKCGRTFQDISYDHLKERVSALEQWKENEWRWHHASIEGVKSWLRDRKKRQKRNEEKLKEVEQQILEDKFNDTHDAIGSKLAELEQKIDNFIEKRFVWNIDTLDNQDKEIKAVLREHLEWLQSTTGIAEWIRALEEQKDKLGSEEKKYIEITKIRKGVPKIYEDDFPDSWIIPDEEEKEPSELKKCPKCGKIMRDQRMKGDYLCAECYKEESPAEDFEEDIRIEKYEYSGEKLQGKLNSSAEDIDLEQFNPVKEALGKKYTTLADYIYTREKELIADFQNKLEFLSCHYPINLKLKEKIHEYINEYEEARKNP